VEKEFPYLPSFEDNVEGEARRHGDFWIFTLSRELQKRRGSRCGFFHVSEVHQVDSMPDFEKNSQKSGNSQRMLSFHPLLTLL
jgi:hypothetical protein